MAVLQRAGRQIGFGVGAEGDRRDDALMLMLMLMMRSASALMALWPCGPASTGADDGRWRCLLACACVIRK